MKKILLVGLLALPSLLLAQAPVLTFTPSNGTTNVALTITPTIVSDVNIKNADASTITDTNVDDLITLKDNLNNAVPFDATIAGKTISVNPTGNLAESTTYTLTIQPVESASGGVETVTQSISFTTGDFTDPTINYARAVDNSGTAFTFLANVDEDAKVYYVVDANATTPSVTQVRTGKNGANAAATRSGSFNVTANVDGSVNITGLAFVPTKYFVYYFAEDLSPNTNSNGVTPRGLPVLTSSSIQNLQSFQLDLRVNVDENATTYYVVTQSATVPSAKQILAGQDESGGAPVAAGSFSVNAATNTNKTINGLNDGTTYHVHFVSTDGSGNQTVVASKTATTTDGTPPSVTAVTPLDGSTTVDISRNTFVITFDENIITSASVASGGSDFVKLFENGVMKEDITRGDGSVGTDGSIVIAGSTATITFVYALQPNKNYYITIGDDVFSDAAGNDFAGYAANTDWNFKTSTVTVNNASSSICSGSFQSIGNIVVSETGVGDFNVGASKTLTLTLSNTSEFVISNSGVSVSGASADVSGLSVSVGLTSLTLTYTVSGTTVLDNITISGLKIYATGVVTSATFLRTGGNGDMDGGNGTGGSSLTYSTINVGATAPAQTQLAASQDLIHCDGEDISTKTLSVVNQGAVTYDWYSDVSLSTLVTSTSATTVNIVSDLGMVSPAVPGTYRYYVVTVGACQSAPPLEVDLNVSVNPVANAGTDKVGVNAVCPGTALTLGGNPTLQTPSAPGAYTYSWDYVEGTPEPASEANPAYTVGNASTTATTTYNFQVTVTDANGCAGTDILTVDVKPTFNISLTSPNSYVFSPSSPNQLLDANPTGGVFTGVGVVQSNATTYQFSPTIAHATDPNTLPKSFNIFYTVTQGGCTQQNFAIATFTISNSFFSGLQPEYCSSEYPNPAVTGVDLGVDLTGFTYIDSRKTSWNTSERFGRVPYSDWNSLGLYGFNAYVRYNSELYRCNDPAGCGTILFGSPPDADADWVVAMKVDFQGYIANYYEGSYGGNASPTVVKSTSTYSVSGHTYNYYRFGTNENYLNCPTCNYAYPAAYLEFDDPEDIKALQQQWFSGYYYYSGDLVVYNNEVYKCIANPYTFNTQPDLNTTLWTKVTNSNYSNGQYFHQYDAGLGRYRSGFYVNGQFVQINRNPNVFFSGLVNGQQVCEFDVMDLDDTPSSGTNLGTLTGNFFNQGYTQDFQVKLDGAGAYDNGGGAINNDAPGLATFDSKKAFANSTGGGSTAKNIQIQYKVDPGTNGSTSQACYGTSVITVQVRENSNFDFDDSVVPVDGSVYCYTEAPKSLRSMFNSTVINGASGTANSVAYSGYGVNDLANSLGSFKPGAAVDQVSPGTTTQQSIPVVAIYRDAALCQSKRTRTFKVNPDIQPSFAFGGRVNYCYEDIPNSFTGHTENFTAGVTTIPSTGKYELVFRDPGGTAQTLQMIGSSNTSFTAKTYYDQVQAMLNTPYPSYLDQAVNVNVIYTETLNAGTVCSETASQTMVINPPIVLDIFGLKDGDELCRNDNTNVTQGNLVTFDGSVSGFGTFHLDDDNNFSSVNPTLDGTVNTTSGKATINLSAAYNAATDLSDEREVFLQYQYTGPGCTGPADVIKKFEISPPPELLFNTGTHSADGDDIFCYNETPVQLGTAEHVNVTLTGYGVTDSGTGGGTGTFNPQLAYNTSISNGGTLNTPQNIVVTARIVDGIGCANVNTLTYTVNPVPQADLVTGSKDYCFEDAPRTLQGQQAKSWFQMVYQGVVTPHTDNNLGNIGSPMSSIPFDPKARFNDAVFNYGASALTPVKFDVFYTVADNNSCTNTIGPYTLTVANQIEVKIAGMDDDDIFCSNEDNGVKALSFNPFPADASKRIFSIGGQTIPLSSDKYNFNPGLAGGDFELHYVVISGNNCTNTDTLSVRVLPSPVSVFNVQPHCEGDLIDFSADGSSNLSSAVYTWTLSDSVRTGQDVQHRFPDVSTYSVQLHVAYPAYNNNPALVCQDSLRLDQIVGPVPKMDFTFFNVCESDETSFVANPDIPISTVSWKFGDGENTGFGFQANNITSSPVTSGKYGAPVHKYAGAGNYEVIVAGKTAPIFGGCLDTDTVQVAILKNWAPSVSEPAYDMSALDGGKGFWVKEDVNGNSTWEFNAPAKTHINSNEMAWVTGATQPYKDGDVSYMNSPCFDLSGFSRPVISIKHWTDTQSSDGAVMQYSVNGGETWERLGNVASGLEWYNQLIINSNPGNQDNLSSGWSAINENQWKLGKHTLDVLPPQRSKVRFRVAFASLRKNTTNQQMDGFAFNDVVIQERNRTILAENFTTLNAINNNTAFRGFHAVNGVFNTAELIKLQYHHASGPTTDELNQANPIDQNARAAFYGVTTPTRAFIDGGFGQTTSNATFDADSPIPLDTYFSLRSLVTAPVDISIDFLPDPSDKLNVKATVQATSAVGNPGQYNVFIAVAEQQVLGQVYVLRKLLPDASGTPLTSLSATDPAQEIIASYDMRHVTRLTNGDYAPFAVIVFVQNLETKEVLQTAIRQDGTASTNIVTGVETLFDNYIKLYPNPSDDHLNIILPAPVKQETPVKLFDTFGKQVYEGNFSTGEHVKEIGTKLLSAGVYLIQLSTPEGLVRKKTMVVHE